MWSYVVIATTYVKKGGKLYCQGHSTSVIMRYQWKKKREINNHNTIQAQRQTNFPPPFIYPRVIVSSVRLLSIWSSRLKKRSVSFGADETVRLKNSFGNLFKQINPYKNIAHLFTHDIGSKSASYRTHRPPSTRASTYRCLGPTIIIDNRSFLLCVVQNKCKSHPQILLFGSSPVLRR